MYTTKNYDMDFEKLLRGISSSVSECGPMAYHCESDNDIWRWIKVQQYLADVIAPVHDTTL